MGSNEATELVTFVDELMCLAPLREVDPKEIGNLKNCGES